MRSTGRFRSTRDFCFSSWPISRIALRQLDQAVWARKVSTVVPFRLTGLQGEIRTGVLSSVTVKSLDGEDRALDADGQEAVP